MVAWWHEHTQDVQNVVSRYKNCRINWPSLGKTVSTRPEADIWERLHIDWGYVNDQGNILVIVDAGSGWIEVFPAGNRTSETVKVSDNVPEFVIGDIEKWCESLGIKQMEFFLNEKFF